MNGIAVVQHAGYRIRIQGHTCGASSAFFPAHKRACDCAACSGSARALQGLVEAVQGALEALTAHRGLEGHSMALLLPAWYFGSPNTLTAPRLGLMHAAVNAFPQGKERMCKPTRLPCTWLPTRGHDCHKQCGLAHSGGCATKDAFVQG